MGKSFIVDHVHLSLAPFIDKGLSKTETQIIWIVESICKKKDWCYYSNSELAGFLQRHKDTISCSVRSLVTKGALISDIEITKAGYRRKLKPNPGFQELKNDLIVEYNGRISTRFKGEKSNGGESGKPPIPAGETTYTPRGKSKDYGGLKNPYIIKIDNKDTFPLEKYGTSGSGQPVQGESTFACQREVESLSDKMVANPRKEDRSMPPALVLVPEEANRTFDYWNSQGEPLPRHRMGTRVHKDAIKAIRKALKIHKEKTIRNAIDVYKQSLTRTDLNLFRFKSAPVRVGLDEFFQFSGFTIGVIADRKIKGFDGGGISWFDICLKGAAEVEQRFAVVPVDKFPVVTKLLQKVIGSWDDHPKVTGPIAEKQLQIVSAKLVEFHQRIKPRMLTGGFLKFSTPEFLKEYFVPYLQEMLGKRGVEGFQLWWMIGDGFVDEFEQYLVRLHTIKKPVMVRHLKRRVGCDQNISFGSGSRAAYHHRYDNECELSAADYQNI